MVLGFVAMVEFNGERIPFQTGLVGLVAAEADTDAVVLLAVDADAGIHQSRAVYAHGVEGIHPVFVGQGDAYFTDGFLVKKWTDSFAGLGRNQMWKDNDEGKKQFFHSKLLTDF